MRAGEEKIGHASVYREMNREIAGSELLYSDTAAHNIRDGYPTRCISDDVLEEASMSSTSRGNPVTTVQAALNPNRLADPHVPRRCFGRERLLASTK